MQKSLIRTSYWINIVSFAIGIFYFIAYTIFNIYSFFQDGNLSLTIFTQLFISFLVAILFLKEFVAIKVLGKSY